MHYLIVGFNYKNASLELRESLNLACDNQRREFLSALIANHDFDEVMLPNTCNRIELISLVKDIHLAKELIFKVLSERSGLSIKALQEQADTYSDEAAVYHLFSVAASLDSLVVGETQIVGQLRNALKFAQVGAFSGKNLEKVLGASFKCAAKVRSTTHISSKPVSIASIAVLKAKEEFGSLASVNALVIGSGDMSRIACQHLLKQGARVTLINRTYQKALDIQKEVGSIIVEPYENLEELLHSNELLLTATSSKEPIITPLMIKPQSFNRVWLDLAVPRDIASVSEDNIEVVLVDDLADIAKNNIELRNSEAVSSYAIVGEKTKEFFSDTDENELEPLIKSIYLKAFDAVSKETQRATQKGFIPKEFESEAQKMGTQMMKRFLHSISDNMRDVSDTKSVQNMMSSLSYLLDIDETTKSKEKEA